MPGPTRLRSDEEALPVGPGQQVTHRGRPSEERRGRADRPCHAAAGSLGASNRRNRCVSLIPDPLQGPFAALPMIIYNWAGGAKAEFKTALAPAAIIVLMAITFLCNGVAVFLRNRYDKRW